MIRSLLIISILSFISIKVNSQNTIKLAHINSMELLSAMPENDSARVKLEKVIKELQFYLEDMQVEFNKKYQEYMTKKNTYTASLAQIKESELQDMTTRMQQFQESAQGEIENKRTEIYKPVMDKTRKVIADVAKENGITYVFDTSNGALLYQSDNSINLMPLVKKKLGLK